MTNFIDDDRFDGLYMNVAQTARGIEPLLDTFFSFLRRKTDFFEAPKDGNSKDSSSSSDGSLEKVKVVFAKHAKLYQQEKEKKEAKKAAKLAAEVKAKKKKADVIEMGTDGGFDVSSDPSAPPLTNEDSTSKSVTDKDSSSQATESKDDEAKVAEGAASAEGTEETPSSKKDGKGDGEDDRPPPPPGNGGTVPGKYVWTQTLHEVVVNVAVPEGTRGRDLNVVIGKNHLKVGLRGKDYIIDAPLVRPIIMDDSFWTVEDGNRLVIQLQKPQGMEWWNGVCEGDPTINVSAIKPENSSLDDLDSEVRQTVEKMWYDQRQKALGLPTSEDEKKRVMMEKLQQQHPEMDFSNCNFN